MAQLDTSDAPATGRSSSNALPVALLIVCCLFWGFSFPAMQIAAATLEKTLQKTATQVSGAVGELAARSIFNFWRFALASGALFLFTFLRQRHFSRADVVGGLVIGITFCLGILLQLIGLRYTLPSTSSFLTALSVIFAPFEKKLLFNRPLGKRTLIAVMVALAGMFILSQPNPFATAAQTIAQTPPFPHLGEILTIVGALLFTAQILSLDYFGQRADATRLTLIMLLTTCVLSLIIGLFLGGGQIHRAAVFTSLLHDQKFLACFAGLALVSSMLSQFLMNRYQPLIAPATASVVYCLEPVFGTLFSVAFGTERLSAITIVGGWVIIIAVLIVARKNP